MLLDNALDIEPDSARLLQIVYTLGQFSSNLEL